jgi:hypothetical protein
MKVYGIPVQGIPLCAVCVDPDTEPATQAHFESFECNTPGCDGNTITPDPECHHRAGLDAEYCKGHGTLTLVCHECHALVETFKIARS